MTELTHIYETAVSYQLTPAEERLLKRYRQMSVTAKQSCSPRVLMVFVDGVTVAFFDGNPSGVVRE